MILVTVSGAAWRMTAPGAPQCLGLGSGGDLGRCGRRPCSGRAPHGLLYPEFQHRPPPPSYQASMQEYRLRYKPLPFSLLCIKSVLCALYVENSKWIFCFNIKRNRKKN